MNLQQLTDRLRHLTPFSLKRLILSLSVIGCASTSLAQTDIFIRGSEKLIPIALPQLCLQSGQSESVKRIPETIARDLKLSGFFEVINPNAYIEAPGKCGGRDGFAYSDWSVIGAERLVRGVIDAAPNGSLRAQLFLHDVIKQSISLGKEYSGDEDQATLIGHRFANEIMRLLTGEAGVFGSQILFSTKVGRFKELAVMDMDGENMRQLTNERSLSVSSNWSPDGRTAIFTSYRRRGPDLFTLDLVSRLSAQITHAGQMILGSSFTRDGQSILASLTGERDSDLVLLNRDGTVKKRLTAPNGAIDVSPRLSPTEDKIIFCSNRSGGPQIYVMDRDGNGAHRISFVNSSYCTSPAWSPKGDKVAFVCRADRGFQIFVSKPDGSDPKQLTSMGDNEDPDWSPDGRYMVFATTQGSGPIFHLALMREDGSNLQRVSNSRGGDAEPAWSPIVP